ncbi:response regulator [Gorillibacterium massiliense]|uniref:response regulator n=1 Tax=Gorillibacterium massiliense TaxID=1280390 RepID=UPI0004B20435|nr:response regulator [Gorillibacterium massiliense]
MTLVHNPGTCSGQKLKALLVDDEPHILHNLSQIIPWEQMGIDIVGLARNGKQALEMAELKLPDLVLTDIRMPVMDGVALLEELRARAIPCEIIMLTGYQDFEYMRSGIQYAVKDYLLKPINYEELEKTVSRVALEIRERRILQESEERMWSQVVRMAYEKALLDVLLGSPTPQGAFLEDGGVELSELSFTVMLLDMDDYSSKIRSWNEKERKLWNFAVRNVLQEVMEEKGVRHAVLQPREGEFCILVEESGPVAGHDDGTAASMTLERDKRWLEEMQIKVRQWVKLELRCALLPDKVAYHSLPDAYGRIQRHLTMTRHNRDSLMIVPAGQMERSGAEARWWGWVEEIVSGLKQRNQTLMKDSLDHLNRDMLALSEQSLVRAEQILHYLVLHLLREMRESGMLAVENEQSYWERLEKSGGIVGLMNLINTLSDDGMQRALSRKSTEMLMLSAEDYIRRNLANDLSIDEIADRLGISYSYFSMLFKNHFGETFIEYLTRERMELAKSLLLKTDNSVTQIGKMTGYLERRYFTKVFAKYAGVSPTEFRERYVAAECAEEEKGNV